MIPTSRLHRTLELCTGIEIQEYNFFGENWWWLWVLILLPIEEFKSIVRVSIGKTTPYKIIWFMGSMQLSRVEEKKITKEDYVLPLQFEENDGLESDQVWDAWTRRGTLKIMWDCSFSRLWAQGMPWRERWPQKKELWTRASPDDLGLTKWNLLWGEELWKDSTKIS